MRKIKGTHQRPRLSIFRSNRMIYAQVIDDEQGKTLVAVCDTNSEKQSGAKRGKEGKKGLGGTKTTKTEKALKVGEVLAKMALKKKIKSVVFDRGNFRYHGRVKALAEGARKGGLDF